MDSGGVQALHATTVAWQGRAVVAFGPSGSGKTELALSLMAHGADLVADDGTLLRREAATLVAEAAPAIAGLIEARGIGILRAQNAAAAQVVLAIDMGQIEPERLPPERSVSWLGVSVPLIFRVVAPHFAPAVLQMLKAGRRS